MEYCRCAYQFHDDVSIYDRYKVPVHLFKSSIPDITHKRCFDCREAIKEGKVELDYPEEA